MNEIIFKKANSPFTLIIFGASGSLARLKLFPAIYELAKENRMPAEYKIVGYARTPMTNEEFRSNFEKSIKKKEKHVDQKVLNQLLENLFYVAGQYDQEDDYINFRKELKKIEKTRNRVRIAYFSVPPMAFKSIFKNLGIVNFNTKKTPLRLVIEKPFGYDLRSAKKLQKILKKYFESEQIYLLDHYLGKEAVSNLLSLRYANPILTTLMDKKYVSNIQIFGLEKSGIEGRSNYFDHVGIIRDMVQSHLLQILTYLTMYLPEQETDEAIHHEKARVLDSIRIKNIKTDVVRGQYKKYLDEPGIPKDSQTETFAALKLEMKHPLWRGVPIYMMAGKALKQKWTAVVIEFKPRKPQKNRKNLPPNRILIQLQPYEKIELSLLTKLGGKTFDFHELTTGRPIYCSGDCLTEHGRLLLDIIAGDRGLFLNFEEIFAAWVVTDPIQKMCSKKQKRCKDLLIYDEDSLGPKAADDLIENDGFSWFYSLPKNDKSNL
ncbi:glucose-6-phosphate dehydrogenase [Patescibacteria group bacterium]|nr:glucose-6-phosphate dehydrogenase [Patescibacteria group bacterium]